MASTPPLVDQDETWAFASRVGRALRLLRAERGFSQVELCRRSGLSSSRVSRYEGGRAEPTLRTIQRILQALDATLSDLDEALGRVLRRAAAAAPTLPGAAATATEPAPLLVIGLVCPLADRGSALTTEAARSLAALERLLLDGLEEGEARGQARRLLARLARQGWSTGGGSGGGG